MPPPHLKNEAHNIKENTKEEYEKNKQKDETSATADALADSVLKEIKGKKSDFSGTITPTWKKDCRKLLKSRTNDQIITVLKYALQDNFWCDKVLSPAKIARHLDSLEIQINKKGEGKWKINQPNERSQSPNCKQDSLDKSTLELHSLNVNLLMPIPNQSLNG